ncbi:MAG: hypothetical protein ACOYMP_07925 [Nodosilinea sp.]
MKIASTSVVMASFPGSNPSFSDSRPPLPDQPADLTFMVNRIQQLVESHLHRRPGGLDGVAHRIAAEVERMCRRSDRIQASGNLSHWQSTLIDQRVNKCLTYYDLGSTRGRIDLHSTLSAIAYRHIASEQSSLSFQGRCELLEDFMQTFYIEALNSFRRAHHLLSTYTPSTRLELAEYMAFSEQYGKRSIALGNGHSQQLIVLRAQAFNHSQPNHTLIDPTLVDSPKFEEGERGPSLAVLQQIREKTTLAPSTDSEEAAMRDRVTTALMEYFSHQNQSECMNYLVLKLKDASTSEIEEILGISSKQRDYLQQRFKYHVERFSQDYQWELVHQWLGANLENSLGMTPDQWRRFLAVLEPQHRRLIALKQAQIDALSQDDGAIASTLGWTTKKVKRTWTEILRQAWQHRNHGLKARPSEENNG